MNYPKPTPPTKPLTAIVRNQGNAKARFTHTAHLNQSVRSTLDSVTLEKLQQLVVPTSSKGVTS